MEPVLISTPGVRIRSQWLGSRVPPRFGVESQLKEKNPFMARTE